MCLWPEKCLTCANYSTADLNSKISCRSSSYQAISAHPPCIALCTICTLIRIITHAWGSLLKHFERITGGYFRSYLLSHLPKLLLCFLIPVKNHRPFGRICIHLSWRITKETILYLPSGSLNYQGKISINSRQMIILLKKYIHRSCLTFYSSFSNFRKIQGCANTHVKVLKEIIELFYYLCSMTEWKNE